MRGILADINIGLQRDALVAIWTSDAWRDLWNELGLVIQTFPALGLAYDSSDAAIWRLCQREGLVLITANRNKHGPDSLEAVIRAENQPGSLPVITVANADRVLRDRRYAERVAERLFDYLMRIDEVRGTGRIYVPRSPAAAYYPDREDPQVGRAFLPDAQAPSGKNARPTFMPA